MLTFYRLPAALAHVAVLLLGYSSDAAHVSAHYPALAILAALLWAADPFVIAYSSVLHADGLAGTFIP